MNSRKLKLTLISTEINFQPKDSQNLVLIEFLAAETDTQPVSYLLYFTLADQSCVMFKWRG